MLFTMHQLLRREFLLKVLMTIGTKQLVKETGLSSDEILEMSLGAKIISNSAIESIYNALTVRV